MSYYTPKTQLAANAYMKNGLTTVRLGNTEYVKFKDVVGSNHRYYRKFCAEGSLIPVRVAGRAVLFVNVAELEKLQRLRDLNKRRWTRGITAPEKIKVAKIKANFGKGWSAADLKSDELDKPKTEVTVPTKELFTKLGAQFSEEEPVVVDGVEVFTSPDFGSIRTRIEHDGAIYLNVEDVARGLGFVELNKFSTSGENYIRWSTVNDYLRQFNFSQLVEKGTYIPENIFYRLAMKAKNEVAEGFQIWISDEVIPKIRKQGYYVRPDIKPAEDNNTNDELLEALKAQLAIQTKIVKLLEQKKD